jgi:hypothetical protein
MTPSKRPGGRRHQQRISKTQFRHGFFLSFGHGKQIAEYKKRREHT